jgi:hypothetical protein
MRAAIDYETTFVTFCNQSHDSVGGCSGWKDSTDGVAVPCALSPATREEIAPPKAPMTPGSPCKLWTRKKKRGKEREREYKEERDQKITVAVARRKLYW